MTNHHNLSPSNKKHKLIILIEENTFQPQTHLKDEQRRK